MLFNSLVIIGLNRSASYLQDASGHIYEDTKGILWKLKYWAIESLGDKWSKPVISCPPCMASLHSFYVFWLWAVNCGIEPFHIYLYILYIPALSGMVHIINNRVD